MNRLDGIHKTNSLSTQRIRITNIHPQPLFQTNHFFYFSTHIPTHSQPTLHEGMERSNSRWASGDGNFRKRGKANGGDDDTPHPAPNHISVAYV